ncbi:MAG: hypothetical protein GKS06_02310 [Acidobacteria bacterium]|nr:hypothetical protein [Acidobacteriota bacterium]
MFKNTAENRKGTKKARTEAIVEREYRQLARLVRVIDVLYALVIWRSVVLLPHPTVEEVESAGSLWRAFLPYGNNFALVAVGIALVVIYWGQNNRLFGNLQRTDGYHASTAVMQVAFVLLFGYFVRIGLEVGDMPQVLAAQSLALVAAGAMAILGWRHAVRDGHLVSPVLGRNEARELSITNFVEPTVAVLTIPLAWVGPTPYTLAFVLGMPAVGWCYKAFAASLPVLADALPEDRAADDGRSGK